MIKKITSLSIPESLEYIDSKDESKKEIINFFEKVSSVSTENAKKIRKMIEELKIIKISDTHISKIIDILPDSEDNLNRLFSENPLNSEESKKIIEIVKQFKKNE